MKISSFFFFFYTHAVQLASKQIFDLTDQCAQTHTRTTQHQISSLLLKRAWNKTRRNKSYYKCDFSMNSKLLFPLILLKMRGCQRLDMYLYLASNWSGLWLSIFSQRFKYQKQAVCVDRLLWAAAACPLLVLFLPHFHNCQQGTVGRCDTESHYDKEVTPPLLAVSDYISLSVFTHCCSVPFTTLLIGLLLLCIPLSSYTTLTARICGLAFPLTEYKQQTSHSQGNRRELIGTIWVVGWNRHTNGVKIFLPCDILNCDMVRRLQKPAKPLFF